ncbi:hypothetical protein EB796_020281 [Bugula neritina]|uniref:Uncharacterized protein n=1 Tax=Bugula neritina TaxID=10212 RepID=A0A7J7J6Q0_BUGNE|nr:hypothetical protein EB796_020281 [Bugula neritina]
MSKITCIWITISMTSTPEELSLTMYCTHSWLEMSVFVKCWLVIHSSTLFWCTLFTCGSLGRGRDSVSRVCFGLCVGCVLQLLCLFIGYTGHTVSIYRSYWTYCVYL